MNSFDDIRPYRDDEIPAAMQRIADSPHFPLLAQYVYPGQDIDRVRNVMRQFQNVYDFQHEVMRCVNEQVIARSTTSFTCEGLEGLDPARRYLFVSNHRDIMLDACLLQYALWQHGHETTEITFGANLMSTPLVIDIGKANKMFRVERGGTPKEFYASSLHLSEYIRHCITEKHQSVWIAQRNGRTKDGNDRTDPGLIRMFGMSRTDDPVQALAELNIVPVAVSYEWESCDINKALELYKSRNAPYVKQPGEDLQSILTGVLQPKGKVQMVCCKPLTTEDIQPAMQTTARRPAIDVKAIASLMDERIIAAYRLTPNNYIAAEILRNEDRLTPDEIALLDTLPIHGDQVEPTYGELVEPTSLQREDFNAHLAKLELFNVPEPSVLRDIFLRIYATPLLNKLA